VRLIVEILSKEFMFKRVPDQCDTPPDTPPDHLHVNRRPTEVSTMIVNACSVSVRPLQNIKKLIKHKKDCYLHYNYEMQNLTTMIPHKDIIRQDVTLKLRDLKFNI